MTRTILLWSLVLTPAVGLDRHANIVGMWHFDEDAGSTTFVDSSYNSLDGTCAGNCPTAGSAGVFNSALTFTGSEEVSVPDDSSLDNTATMTWQMWFYPRVADGNPDAILSKRTNSSTDNSYSIFLYTAGRITVDIVGFNDRQSSSTIFSTNRWYHVVVTYDGALAGNEIDLFINGTSDANFPTNETSNSIPDNGSTLLFGTMDVGYAHHFTGLIDEISIYDIVLTRSEIEEAYERGRWRLLYEGTYCDGRQCAFGMKTRFGLENAFAWLKQAYDAGRLFEG